MNQRRRVALVVATTVLVAFTVGAATERVRDAVLTEWRVENGDEFLYGVCVKGFYKVGVKDVPPPLADVNNTCILATITSLPNITIFMRLSDFGNLVIAHSKTSSVFENGTAIPIEDYQQINELVSRCVLPVGNWLLLDAHFPDAVSLTNNSRDAKSFIGADFGNVFLIGFARLSTEQGSGWFGYVNKTSGVPQNMTMWGWSVVEPFIYSYNMTLALLD